MTPNKPEVEAAAEELVSPRNSAIENQTLRLIARLAKTITYNAEAMNKLVCRVDELEKLVADDKSAVQPVSGHQLQVLLAQPHVQRVKCVKSESHMWKEGKEYQVLVNASDRTLKVVWSETGKPLRTSRSLFVEVTPQNEPFELTFNRPSVYNTQCETSDADEKRLVREEQLRHHQFMEVSRMFMGLPTNHLIHPRSL